MSLLLDTYRKNAVAALSEADRSTLPNIRQRAALSADRWSEMADRLEWVEEQGRIRAGRDVATTPRT
jgi:hypothetical protein